MFVIQEQLNWLTELATTLLDKHIFFIKYWSDFLLTSRADVTYTKEKAPKCPQITSAILF